MSVRDSGGGAASRPSKNNCPGDAQPDQLPDWDERGITEEITADDMPDGTAQQQLSVRPGQTLRDELVVDTTNGCQSINWEMTLRKWRQWYDEYLSKHIEYENGDGETVRTQLENSYMPEYGDRYYAKIKGVEREIERVMDSPTTVMLTDTASTLNANGLQRCPVDHMRDIANGWDAQRKALHRILEDYDWEYCKIWEPHPGGERGAAGYGHMHIGIFVDDPGDEIDAEMFEPAMKSYYDNCDPAGWDAHKPDNSVSVTHSVDNLASYLSEYIGVYGDDPLDRPAYEQMFYATAWASNTRKVEFSNGAQELMQRDQYRRETGLIPEKRGQDCEAMNRWKGDDDGDSGSEWTVSSIVEADPSGPDRFDATDGGVTTTAIDGNPKTDPPPTL